MTQRTQMTLLQRAVIQRLRESATPALYGHLADAARAAWSRGERVALPNIINGYEAELRADFDRANEQAGNDVERSNEQAIRRPD
jgi:hypothetical protein